MFKIEGKTINLTRGDAAKFSVSTKNSDNTDYTFKVGDVIRFTVFKAKCFGKIELSKDFEITEEGTLAYIDLTKEDTKIGELINKPTTYWYEVTLNPNTNPQTIIGYDKDKQKEFILYPESGDENA